MPEPLYLTGGSVEDIMLAAWVRSLVAKSLCLAAVTMVAAEATADESRVILRVKSLAGAAPDEMRFRIENTSALDVENVSLSLKFKTADDVSIEYHLNLKQLPAQTSADAAFNISGGAATTRVMAIEVEKNNLRTLAGKRTRTTIQVEFDRGDETAGVAH